jgi:transcriptional regulator with XRE-family HTH domain
MEKAFGTLVRQLRLQQGYSLRELARRVGLSPNFLSKMELGYFPPPGETVSRENHTAVVGESGPGKSLLTKYLIRSYFRDAHVRVYDSDAARPCTGKAGNSAARSSG